MSNTDSKQLTQEQLAEILDLHVKWLRNEPGGVQANLSYANLTGANLQDADLTGANLSGANLTGANLPYANLQNADLTGASLVDACLERAILDGAKLPSPVLDLSNCNVGYKKVYNKNFTQLVVIELRFSEGAQLVSTVVGRKCRASEAVVVGCVTPRHKSETQFWSMHDDEFAYRVGETVRPTEPFDDSMIIECTSGIHFFTTPEEAEEYAC